MATIDGSIQLVKVVTDAELRQNGGSFVVAGRMAQPIQGFDTLTKRAGGGNTIPVYVVSDAQIANGTFRLKGGSALPMADIDVVAAGVKTIQGAAIPVYVVSGSLGAGGAAVPDAPANLIATAISGSQVDLSWDSSNGATGYKIERSTNGVDFTEIQDQAGTTYSNTGLSGVLTFTYRVIAYNATGDSSPSSTAAVAYYQRILATQAANLIALWRLNETSGTTAIDYGPNNLNGTYARDVSTMGTAAGIGDGDTAPVFNGVNDFVNFYSAGLNAAWNGAEFTVLMWIKMTDWMAAQTMLNIEVSNPTEAQFTNAVNDQLTFRINANSTTKTVNRGSYSPTTWIHIGMTNSESADQFKAFILGVQEGTTQTGLGAWTGNLNSTRCNIGCADNAVTSQPAAMQAAHLALWNTILTPAEIAALANLA